ncbi:hypothetical protein pb186bvf_017463 [Paramecium bursaria]
MSEEKQQYLREQIVDQGYDVEACSGFLISQRPDLGDDLDLWDMESLAVVQQEQIEEKIEYLPIECQKCSINELSDGSQSVKITKYEKQSAGFFKSSYVNFKIETSPIGWIVQRRYSDFEWLRCSLLKLFPGYIIPPIHKKRTRNFEEGYLTKRQIFLERFLNNLMDTFELRSNLLLKVFLSCDSQSEFNNFQQSINNSNNIENVHHIRNKDGLLILQQSQQQDQYIHLTNEFFQSQELQFKKIRTLSKKLKQTQLDNALVVYNIGEAFSNMYNSVNKLNMILPMGQYKPVIETYINLNNMMITWGNILNTQVEQTEGFFNSFFKYQQHYALSVKQFYQKRNNLASELDRYKQKLHYKKEKLFEQADPTKWEMDSTKAYNKNQLLEDKKLAFQLMCEQETRYENKQQQMMNYLNCQIFNESQAYFRIQCKQLVQQFILFTQQQAVNISENHILWADVMVNLRSCKVS